MTDRQKIRALAKLSGEANRMSQRLSELRPGAEGLSFPLRVQLNNAIEELDLLVFYLHEETLRSAVAAAATKEDTP